MKAVVFSGPTLAAGDVRAELDAICRPPAAQGDVYRATRERPLAIGIIDGYFERQPAVWHKEILWAMSRGIHVFGSASMGALRAAELAPFGMEGVGEIFRAFAAGELEDDDEVTVVHGPADDGYRAISEAMVNVRATLAAAAGAGVIPPSTRERLVALAKSLFYPERTYPAILRLAVADGLAPAEIESLEDWLPDGRVDQKRADALAMLRRMRELRESGAGPKKVRFPFHHTDAWERVRLETDPGPATAPDQDAGASGEAVPADVLLEELRLQGDGYHHAFERAMRRSLALEVAQHRALEIDRRRLAETAETFRRERGLLEPRQMEAWLAERGLDEDELLGLLDEEARVLYVETLFRSDAERQLVRDERLLGERYAALVARLRDKRLTLAAHGLRDPSLADAGLSAGELWQWFFEERLGQPVPADLDAWAGSVGFSGAETLRRAVLREYCYLCLEHPEDAAAPSPKGDRG